MAVTLQNRTEISALYVALFGRAPDAEGLAYWASEVDKGQSITSIANRMYATAPARAYYPTSATDIEIVNSFYQNVLGRPADPQGQSFWLGRLVALGDRGALIQEMITTVVNYSGAASNPALNALGFGSRDLFLNKVEVAVYYGLNGGNITNATGALQNVTADAASVTPAKVNISLTFPPVASAPPAPGQSPVPAPPPVISATTPIATITDDVVGVATGPVRFKIVFNKPVTGFAVEDIVVKVADDALFPPTVLSDFVSAGDGQTYFVTFTPPAGFVGSIMVDLARNGARDTGNIGNAVVMANIQLVNTSALTTTADITDVTDDVVPVQGSVVNNGATNDTTPTIKGTLSAPLAIGEVLAVFDGSTKLGNAQVTGSTWAFTPEQALIQGSHAITAVVMNNASGNKGVASSPRNFIVDTTPPSFGSATKTVSVKENDKFVDTFTATDAGAVGMLRYSLAAGVGDAAKFTVDANTGEVTFIKAPDYEVDAKSYAINVVATDKAGLTSSQAVTINVTDVNEAPTAGAAASVSVSENTTAVGTFAATDVDAGDMLTYSLSGTDAAKFNVAAGGVVTFKAARNYEVDAKSYAINVVATDKA